MQTHITKELPNDESDSFDPLSQAAIILLSIGEVHAAAVLRCLSRDQVLELTQAMSVMGGIKVESVTHALKDFFERFREQSGVHGGSRGYLQRTLDIALGSDIATTVLDDLYGDRIQPKIALLQWASPRWLARHISKEDVRMQALFLAFLPPLQASQVVELLPLNSRDALLVNVSKLGDVDRTLLVELEEVIALCLTDLNLQGASVEGARQAANIINRMPNHRARTLASLRAYDPIATVQIESNMYPFELLAFQIDPVMEIIMQNVSFEEWAIALRGQGPEVAACLRRVMPRLQVQTFDETILRVKPVSKARSEQLRRDIMARVKSLADTEVITLRLADSEDQS